MRASDGSERSLEAPLIFINAGARPSVPPIPGLNEVDYLDSTSVMELGEAPEHLIALGGGFIGLEFGQMFRRFGSRVTIVERAPRLLPREDEDVSEELAKILGGEGVEVLTEANAERIEARDGGGVRVMVSQGGGERGASRARTRSCRRGEHRTRTRSPRKPQGST